MKERTTTVTSKKRRGRRRVKFDYAQTKGNKKNLKDKSHKKQKNWKVKKETYKVNITEIAGYQIGYKGGKRA